MRRFATILLTLGLIALTLPAQALAQAPDRFTDAQTFVACDSLANDAGTAYLSAGVSNLYGGFVTTAFWPNGSIPFEDDPAWIGFGDQVTLAADGSMLEATVDLHAYPEEPMSEAIELGDPIGTAVVSATLQPSGDPVSTSIGDNDAVNRRFMISGLSQPLAVSGSLTMSVDATTHTFALDTCLGAADRISFFATNPDSAVFQSSHIELGCSWESEDGFVSLFAISDREGSFGELFVADASGEYIGGGEVMLTTSAYAASIELMALDGPEEAPAGTATAAATLMPGQRLNDRFSFDQTKVHVTGRNLGVYGTLDVTLPSGDASYAMDASSCFAADIRVTEIATSQQGPRAKPLANDLPENALPISVGEAVSVATGGTAVEPEAPCLIEDPEFESVELPFGHTAWWSLDGTGTPVTIDTAGSDYDTAVAVYVAGESGLEQVACVDDVDSLQARVTVDTVEGVTYLVQVGGFGGDAGHLELRVD